MSVLDWVGYLAAFLTTFSFVPQVRKSWLTRDFSGVSTTMYTILALGLGVWIAYGVALKSWPIIVANVVTLALVAVVLLLKWRGRWQLRARQAA